MGSIRLLAGHGRVYRLLTVHGALLDFYCQVSLTMQSQREVADIDSAGSIPGRILPSYVADKLGYFRVMTLVMVTTGLSILCLWIPFDYHHSHAGIVVFAIVYGFNSGAFVSLLMPCAAKSGSIENLGQVFGTFQTVISIS